MTVRTEQELTHQIYTTIQDAINDAELSDVGVEQEVRISKFIPPTIKGEFTDLSFKADLLVYKEVAYFPNELDNIENIERWFPSKSVRVPIVVIEVKQRESFSDFFDPDLKLKTSVYGTTWTNLRQR